MLILLKNNQYTFMKRKEYSTDKEFYTQILKLKYKTSLKNDVANKQKIIRYVKG